MSYDGEMTREEAHRLKQAADLCLSLRAEEREAFRLGGCDPSRYLDIVVKDSVLGTIKEGSYVVKRTRFRPAGSLEMRLAAEAYRFVDGLAEGFCAWAGIERSRASFVAAEMEAGE